MPAGLGANEDRSRSEPPSPHRWQDPAASGGHHHQHRAHYRDRNFTKGKIVSHLVHLEAEVGRYIHEADRIDRRETGAVQAERAAHMTGRYHRVRHEIERLLAMNDALAGAPDGQISLKDPDARAMMTRARHGGLVVSLRRGPSFCAEDFRLDPMLCPTIDTDPKSRSYL